MQTEYVLSEQDRQTLAACPLIAKLAADARERIFASLSVEVIAPGMPVIRQGDTNRPFFILLEGAAEVRKIADTGLETTVAALGPGTYFGEQAILGNNAGHSAASVYTVVESRVAVISRDAFLTDIAGNRENRAVFDETILTRCPPLEALEAAAKAQVLAASRIATYAAGADVITQDTVGDSFFVVLEGNVEVVKREESGREIKLVELTPGAYFGEQALLGNAFGRRSATVRALDTCRVAAIPAAVFAAQIARADVNRERFESDASRYVYEEISRSLDSFVAAELDEAAGGVERLTFQTGDTLVTEGEPSDAAFLILSGVALVLKRTGDHHREMARLGTGQVVGELGVLKGQPRAATVLAESQVEVLKIPAPAFVRWLEAHPQAGGFFDTLSHVYTLSEGRRLSLFMGNVGGRPAVTSIVGKADAGIVSTRILNQGVVVFSNAKANAVEGERHSLTFASDQLKRELRVIVKEREHDKIRRGVVYAVAAEGIESDLGTLYQHVANLDEVQAVELRRFEKTGFLGGHAERTDRLCPCLGLGRAELSQYAQELGCNYETLQANVGVGSICGGCERTVRGFLEAGAPAAQAEAPSTPAPAGLAADSDGAPAPEAVADVPPDLLTRDEKQLAALLARGMGQRSPTVTREQLEVRLRATGVRDMKFFVDMLFPGVFTKYARATYATLAMAVSRGIGFGPWRDEALAPKKPAAKAAHAAALATYALGRKGIVALVALAAALHFGLAPESAGPVWAAGLAVLGLTFGALSLGRSGRFVRTLLGHGPARYYRALYGAYGDVQDVGVLKLPAGPPTFIVRDEALVDQVLQNPHVFARLPVAGYPPFAEHSVLGGGSSGVWLGYRVLYEEYFAEGYHADLDQIRAIVRERIAMWHGRPSIDLLKEMYRIMVEIRARVFFQDSFGCFDDHAEIDYAGIVDRVLSPQVLLVNGTSGGEVEVLRERVLTAIRGATKKDSIGGITLAAWQAGELNEREACENGVMYVLAQAPTMGVFWTLYRAARDGRQQSLRDSRKELVKAIKEELRLHAPVTSMFRRQALRDDQLGDLPVSAGDLIILCPMFIHTNPRQWTEPMRYDPERWTAHIGDAKEIVEPKTDPADGLARPGPAPEGSGAARYLPFGGGGQACQGRWFAADEMLIVAEEILKHYDLELIEDQGLLDKPLHDQVTLHVYNRPANDVRVKPISRPS